MPRHTSHTHPEHLLKQHIEHIHHLIQQAKYTELASFIEESLFKTQSVFSDQKPAYEGDNEHEKTQRHIYLNLVSKTLKTLCEVDVPNIPPEQKLKRFKQADKNYGRPALMLSGGGTFGIYHIGVVAELIEQNLLPEVICGTSMGAIVAGILATHHDNEILDLLKHPETSHYRPLKRRNIYSMFKAQSVLEDEQLLECVLANIGDMSFQEAFERTGREVSITISPSRAGQKPRILNHHTSPKVLVAYAAKASCSIPGLFPACQLLEKDAEGKLKPYLSDERWYDGSFSTDIPRQRISRLYNANFFIVSQANPHILPFLSQRQQSGTFAFLKDIAVSSVYAQSNALLKVSRRRLNSHYWSSWTLQLSQLFEQEYSGDINLHPDFPPSWYLKFMKNPSDEEINYLHETGRQSAKHWINVIREQTLISRTLRQCIEMIESKK